MTYPGLRHRSRKRLRKASESGQALVELAFCVPILVLLLLGAVEFARFAYLGIEMSNAAKAAAQYGGRNSVTAADISGMQAAAALDAPDAQSACTNFTTTVQQPATCECRSGGSATSVTCGSGSTCASGTYQVQYLTITTSAQCAPLIYPSGFGGTLTLSGHAVQEVMR